MKSGWYICNIKTDTFFKLLNLLWTGVKKGSGIVRRLMTTNDAEILTMFSVQTGLSSVTRYYIYLKL